MVPAATVLAQTAAAPKPRFVGIFFPHGMAPGYWVPETEGALPAKLPYILESLENVKDQTVDPERPAGRKSAEPPEGTTGSDHWVAAAFLTRHQAAEDRRRGRDRRQPDDRPDHRAEDRPGERCCRRCSSRSRIRARTRATAARATAARTRTRSRGSTLPTPPNEPLAAHQPAADGAEPAGRVRADVRRAAHAGAARGAPACAEPQHPRLAPRRACRVCRRELGAGDRRDGRPVHRRDPRDRAAAADCGEGVERSVRRTSIVPAGVPESFDEHIKLQFDLLALAFQADITRVGDAARRARPDRPQLSVPEERALPERRRQRRLPRRLAPPGRPGADRRYADLNRYHVSTLAYFAEKLRDDSGRRRHAARSLAGAVRHQHGQLEPAPALRRAAHSRRRRQR